MKRVWTESVDHAEKLGERFVPLEFVYVRWIAGVTVLAEGCPAVKMGAFHHRLRQPLGLLIDNLHPPTSSSCVAIRDVSLLDPTRNTSSETPHIRRGGVQGGWVGVGECGEENRSDQEAV
jgi:hypothetical protein